MDFGSPSNAAVHTMTAISFDVYSRHAALMRRSAFQISDCQTPWLPLEVSCENFVKTISKKIQMTHTLQPLKTIHSGHLRRSKKCTIAKNPVTLSALDINFFGKNLRSLRLDAL